MSTVMAPAEQARTIKRRPFLTTGATRPLLTESPVGYIERFEAFLEATGLPPERVLATPVVPTPIPVPSPGEGGKAARWSGVAPEMMWHPLFWLPERISARYQYPVIDEIDGGTSDDFETETDEAWAIRVMLEMVWCGLYSPADGTWLDVLAYYGLDSEDPIDLARVQVWQEGAADEILDSIDLTSLTTNPEDPEWAFESAHELSPHITAAQWSLTARGLLDVFNEHEQDATSTDGTKADVISVMGRVAINSLRTIPADETGVSVAEVIETIVDSSEAGTGDQAYLFAELKRILEETADDFDPYLQGFEDLF